MYMSDIAVYIGENQTLVTTKSDHETDLLFIMLGY